MEPVTGIRIYPGLPPEVVKIDFNAGLGKAIDPEGSVKYGEVIRVDLGAAGWVHGYCDEEGRGNGQIPNFDLPQYGVIHGPVIFSDDDGEGGEADLSPEKIAAILVQFA